MDKNELERRLEAAEKQMIGLQDEIKNLKAKLADLQDEPEIPDFPKFKRESAYWSVDDEFTLQKSIHSGYVGEKGIKDDEANEQSGCCAYCQNTISEHADTVICTDGRRYHAECYLRYIEEGKNVKTNSEAP